MQRLTCLAHLAALPAASLLAWPAQAQAYPSRPVKLIVGFPPGGGIDQAAL